MLRNPSLILCLTLAVIAAGCSNADAPAPAPDTRAADIQAVKDLEVAWAKDGATRDPEKWASYFADGGSGLYPGGPTLHGKAAVKAAMASLMTDPNFVVSFRSDRMMASKGGDMVYSEGAYTMTMTDPKTKKPVTDKGKYLTVYTKQPDGSWKAIADTFNSDGPMM